MTDENVFVDDDRQESSGSTRVVLWILGISAVGLLVCCGIAGIGAWRFGSAAKTFVQNLTTSDPDEIRRQTAEMVDIEIPESYKPMQGMNMGVMRMMMYQSGSANNSSADMLMLMEMTMQQFGVDSQQQESELRKSMQQQNTNQGFTTSKSERRMIDIRGEKVPFEFVEGTNSGTPGQDKKVHMISGVFKGKRGPVMLQLVIPGEDYDEEVVMKMLQSIK